VDKKQNKSTVNGVLQVIVAVTPQRAELIIGIIFCALQS